MWQTAAAVAGAGARAGATAACAATGPIIRRGVETFTALFLGRRLCRRLSGTVCEGEGEYVENVENATHTGGGSGSTGAPKCR